MQSVATSGTTGWRNPYRDILRSYIDRRSFSSVLSRISTLAAYLVLVRIVSAVGFIVALWLCPVQIFADLGVYLAAINLAALAVFGRYETLIISAPGDRECSDAIHLCLVTGVIVVGTSGFIAGALLFDNSLPLFFVYALFGRGWLRLGLSLATRHGRYDRAVRALLPHAIGQPVLLVYFLGVGRDSLSAFVLSDLLGHIIAAVCVTISEWRAMRNLFWKPFRLRDTLGLARRNINLPVLNLPAAASAFLFATSPLYFLPGLPNIALAGTLALLFRLLDVPTSLTTSSISPILLKEISDRRKLQSCVIPRITFLLPVLVAVIVFSPISIGGATLNSFKLLPAWHVALTILPVVALFQAGIAATAPLIDIAALAGRQKLVLVINVISVGFAGTALVLLSGAPIFALFLAGFIGLSRAVAVGVLVGSSQEFAT